MHTEARAVVIGIDDLDHDRVALRWATEEAAVRQIGLRVVHAYEWRPSPIRTPRLRSVPVTVVQQAREQAEKVVQAAVSQARQLRRGVEISSQICEGSAADALVEQSQHAELIVLGSRLLPTLQSFFLGSVGQSVAERAECPVLVIRREPTAAAGQRVIVGVDLEGDSEAALGFAFEEAQQRRLPLEAVTCWRPDQLDTQSLLVEVEAVEQAAVEETLCDRLAPWMRKYPAIEVTATVADRRPVPGLVEATAGRHLLVLGRHSRHPMMTPVLGSVHLGALHHASCPVAVVPDPRIRSAH